MRAHKWKLVFIILDAGESLCFNEDSVSWLVVFCLLFFLKIFFLLPFCIFFFRVAFLRGCGVGVGICCLLFTEVPFTEENLFSSPHGYWLVITIARCQAVEHSFPENGIWLPGRVHRHLYWWVWSCSWVWVAVEGVYGPPCHSRCDLPLAHLWFRII